MACTKDESQVGISGCDVASKNLKDTLIFLSLPYLRSSTLHKWVEVGNGIRIYNNHANQSTRAVKILSTVLGKH
jgi:hypothetical protein